MKTNESESVSVQSMRGQRGPVDHERRNQILVAAKEHFRVFGYKKTSVADLAKAIGLSNAYMYKFFDSKQAIGEAVCSMVLRDRTDRLEKILAETTSPVEALRRIYRSLALSGAELFFENRRMHDIVAATFEEKWQSLDIYNDLMFDLIKRLVLRGRETGDFERKSPLAETCRCIHLTMQPFIHPVLLEQNLDHLEQDATAVANFALSSLAP
jgi:AcrR family transcriptional regulator